MLTIFVEIGKLVSTTGEIDEKVIRKLEEKILKKTIGLLCSLVLLIGCILPIKPAFAKENNGGNNEKMVQVVLYSDKDQVIMSEVPKNYEKEYLAKLEDSTFRNAEIQKSLGVNTSPETANPNVAFAAASAAYVDYMTKSDVIRMVDSMDDSINWSLYISNPLTDLLVTTAVLFP